jgi:hypothetical protein
MMKLLSALESRIRGYGAIRRFGLNPANTKPDKQIRILFTCGLGEGTSEVFSKRFIGLLKKYGFSLDDYDIQLGQTKKKIRDEQGHPLMADKPIEQIIEMEQGFDYVIHRFYTPTVNNKNVFLAYQVANWEADKGDDHYKFMPLLEMIVRNHYK